MSEVVPPLWRLLDVRATNFDHLTTKPIAEWLHWNVTEWNTHVSHDLNDLVEDEIDQSHRRVFAESYGIFMVLTMSFVVSTKPTRAGRYDSYIPGTFWNPKTVAKYRLAFDLCLYSAGKNLPIMS